MHTAGLRLTCESHACVRHALVRELATHAAAFEKSDHVGRDERRRLAQRVLILRLREARGTRGVQIDDRAVRERADALEASHERLDFEAHEFHSMLPPCMLSTIACNLRGDHNKTALVLPKARPLVLPRASYISMEMLTSAGMLRERGPTAPQSPLTDEGW